MNIGVPQETFPGERRVALTPGLVSRVSELGGNVVVETGAGSGAGFSDEAYTDGGARIASREDVFQAEIVLQVRTLGANPEKGRGDLELVKKGQVHVGFAEPLVQVDAIRELARRGVVLFALELLPRTTRAQAMDAMTSMATLAGYKAVLLAAVRLPKLFPMMVTAAGTLAPARLLVIGCGVAGLQAIATARRLGATVTGYDVRPGVQEEVESLGARFADVPLAPAEAEDEHGYARALGEEFYRRQGESMQRLVRESDVVITTASVPGREAPRLVTASMVGSMPAGAVVVDLAAPSGGNCELTQPDQTVEHGGVSVLGPTSLSATMPLHASQMYARNLAAFVENLMEEGRVRMDPEDEILRETLVTRDGEIVHPRVREIAERRAR